MNFLTLPIEKGIIRVCKMFDLRLTPFGIKLSDMLINHTYESDMGGHASGGV